MRQDDENTIEKGMAGEEAAVNFLVSKGLKILDRNWRVGHKEVDIIAIDGQYVAFIEVKTRKTPPQRIEDLISRTKMQNLLSAASYYIKAKHITQECRFDVMVLIGSNGKYDINFMPGAFRSYLR